MCGSHALNLAFGFAPATTALGPVISELPPTSAERGEIALTFDDGPDAEVTPRVLDLLDESGAQATFFCVGARARAYPQVVREIASRGHAVENHAFGHSRAMGFWGVGRMVRDIGEAQKTLADITGQAPKFFRAPFGIRTPLTEPALARLGLRCVAWNVRSLDSVDGRAERVAARIGRRLAPGAIVLMHDGMEGRRRRQTYRARSAQHAGRTAIGARNDARTRLALGDAAQRAARMMPADGARDAAASASAAYVSTGPRIRRSAGLCGMPGTSHGRPESSG